MKVEEIKAEIVERLADIGRSSIELTDLQDAEAFCSWIDFIYERKATEDEIEMVKDALEDLYVEG